jgi:hypothetical protein
MNSCTCSLVSNSIPRVVPLVVVSVNLIIVLPFACVLLH